MATIVTRAGKGSPLTFAEVDANFVNLNTDKAELSSPALTGTPTAPTAAADTNTTQIATTEYVLGQASSTNPVMDGLVSIGTSLKYARADHVHPTDTSRSPLAGSSSITTVGTITSGTWNGTTIAVANGGTGTTTGSITGSGALTFTAGGTDQNVRLTPSGTGSTILDGNVGIGTGATSPQKPLHIIASGTTFGVSANRFPLRIQNSESAASADTGIELLTYNGTSVTSQGYILSTNSAWTFGVYGANSTSLIGNGNGGTNVVAANASGIIKFATGGDAASNERMRIDSSGNVGIGTASPGAALEVKTASATNSLIVGNRGSNTSNACVFISGGNIGSAMGLIAGDGIDLRIPKGSTGGDTVNALAAESSNTGTTNFNNVQILLGATNSSSGKRAAIAYIGDDNALTFRTGATGVHSGGTLSGTERLRITSGGNVGLNTTNPTQYLHVASRTAGDSPTVLISNDGTITGNSTLLLQRNFADFARIRHNPGGLGDALAFLATHSGNPGITFSTSLDGVTISERLRIDSSGNVGIGTASPAARLEVENGTGVRTAYNADADDLAIDGPANTGITISSANNAIGSILFADNDSNLRGAIQYTHTTNALYLSTDGSERLRIDSIGRVLVGSTSARNIGTSLVSSSIQVEGTNSSNSSILAYCNANTAPNSGIIVLGKSRGTTVGSVTAVQSGDSLGRIHFMGADGTSGGVTGAFIIGQVDGTVATNVMPGALTFWTTPASSNTPLERLRIDSLGKVGIGKAPSGAAGCVLDLGGSTTTEIRLRTTTTGTTNSDGLAIQMWDDNNVYLLNYEPASMVFGTSGTERLRIDSSGFVGIGTSSPSARLHVASNLMIIGDGSGNGAIASGLSTGRVIYGGGIGASVADSGSLIARAASAATNPHGVELWAGGTERLRINSAGNVGLNTTNPTQYLHVASRTAGDSPTILVSNDGTTLGSATLLLQRNSIDFGRIKHNAGGSSQTLEYVATHGGGSPGHRFYTSLDGTTLTERLRIDFNGAVGIGGAPASGNTLRLTKNIEGSTTSNVILSDGAIQSGVTTGVRNYFSAPTTATSAFTCGFLQHFAAQDVVINAGSAVTNQTFYAVNASSGNATGSNIGFDSSVPFASTTKQNWNIRTQGAPSFFQKFVHISKDIASASDAQTQKALLYIDGDMDLEGGQYRGIYVQSQPNPLTATGHAAGIWSSVFTADFSAPVYSSLSAFRAEDITSITAPTIAAGFYGNISSASFKYNLYCPGTAQNALAGKTSVGTASAPTSTLTVDGSGSFKAPSQVNAATYTVAETDSSLIFHTTACTVTLPTASSYPGRILYVKNRSAIAVTSNASNVKPLATDTAGTAILTATAGKFAMLQSDGTNWVVMMAN